MKKTLSQFFFILLTFISSAQSPYIFLQGKITENGTDENLIGATIYILNSNQAANTDAFGLYRAHVLKGKCSLVASYVGFAADTLQVNFTKDTTLNFKLNPIGLREVVVQANKIKISERLGTTAIPMAQLKSIPAILGEPDVLRALTMLPGVSNGTEGSVGLNVRGGSPDQNLILMDGAAIYNSSHIFGFLSAFNADAIKRVELIKGGFPARYGGRLSSVIDITFKDGNKEKKSTEFGIGVLASKIFTEGAIKKGRSSYMLAARASYLDLVNISAKRNFYKGGARDFRNYNFYDFNAKVSFLIGKSGALSAGIFRTNDFFINAQKHKTTSIYENTLSWSNTIGNIRYVQPLGKKLLYNTQLTFNRYFYDFNLKNTVGENVSNDNNFTIGSATTIYDIGYKNNFNWSLNEKWNIIFGTELYRQFFKPNIAKFTFEGTDLGTGGSQNVALRKSFSAATFADIQTKWTEHLNSNIGVRLANYNVEKQNYVFVEPRLSLNFDINEKSSLKASYSIMNQPLHILSNTTVGFTNDAWVPATKLTPPESAQQFALGYVKNFPRINTYITIETFYKAMKNLIDYSEGSNPVLDNSTKGYEQIVQKNGVGRAYGLEILLHKEVGKFNGIVEYTLSRTERQFNKINQGRWYPSRFDRTHDFGLTLNYDLTKRWTISSTFVYSTGTAFTGPNHVFVDKSFYNGELDILPFYGSKNNLRLPNYHRMDLGLTYKKTTTRNRDVQWSIGAYNFYNRENVIATRFYSGVLADGSQNIIGYQGYYQKLTLFPFIPYISYNIKLK